MSKTADTSTGWNPPRKPLSIEHIQKLGRQPRIAFTEGLETTYQWVLKNKKAMRDHPGSYRGPTSRKIRISPSLCACIVPVNNGHYQRPIVSLADEEEFPGISVEYSLRTVGQSRASWETNSI